MSQGKRSLMLWGATGVAALAVCFVVLFLFGQAASSFDRTISHLALAIALAVLAITSTLTKRSLPASNKWGHLILGCAVGIAGLAVLIALLGIWVPLNPKTLPQQLANGILLGAIYALIALGYTMVYGVLRLINFAHGEVFMLGAYTSLIASWMLGYNNAQKLQESNIVNLLILLVASMLVCGFIGVLIERLAYRPMRGQARIASLITAIGVSLLIQYGGALVLPVSPPPSINEKVNPFREVITVPIVKAPGALESQLASAQQEADAKKAAFDEAKARNAPSEETRPLRVASNDAEAALRDIKGQVDSASVKVLIPQGQAIMFLTTLILMAILTYVVMYTRVGRQMRAVSHDFDSASLMGINVNTVITVTFLIGSMLAGAGAMMNATFLGTPLTTQYGVMPGVKAFVAAVLGGIGNIPGAVLGGLLMGVAESLVTWMGFSSYRDAIAFVVLIIVLLVKPGGLLGSAKVEKV